MIENLSLTIDEESFSLWSPQIFHQVLLYIQLRDNGQTPRQCETKFEYMSRRGLTFKDQWKP